MKAPTNTRTETGTRAGGLAFLAEQMVTGRAIENQEARGQRELVGSDTLPKQMSDQDRATLEAWGVRFLGDVPGDDLFVYATLPEGWSKKETDHSMWSKLYDERGRERAAMFYKAAFYDRVAHLHVSHRYTVQTDYDAPENIRRSQCFDGETVMHTVEVPIPDGKTKWDVADEADSECRKWFDEKVPHWRDLLASWDD